MGAGGGSFFSKGMLVMGLPKKCLLSVLVALIIIYICSMCVEQYRIPDESNLVKTERTERHSNAPNIRQSEVSYVHYPQPKTYRRNECARTPVQFFAILSMQRSGSGWFETLLNSHINVSSNGEIFSVKERRSNLSSITRTLDKVYNLDWYSSASRNECTAAVGFKWMLNQGLMQNHEEIVKYFNQRGVSAIFLLRRNLLRRLVSVLSNLHDRSTKQLNGTHKAHVHSKDEANILARYKPTINVTSLIRDLKHADRWTADALKHFKSTRHTLLYYEDLVSNRTKLLDVLDFLGVPQRELVSHHVKIHTQPLPDQIENWDAVYSTLTGTHTQFRPSVDQVFMVSHIPTQKKKVQRVMPFTVSLEDNFVSEDLLLKMKPGSFGG